MSDSALTLDQLCAYFEHLAPTRRDLVWVRCENALGGSMEDFDPSDPLLDEVFEGVLREMWVNETLERLVQLGVLQSSIRDDGTLFYCSAE